MRHPVGTQWTGVDKAGTTGNITLIRSDYYFGKDHNLFQASWSWSDDSGGTIGYFRSYRSARYWLGTFIEAGTKFRIMEEQDETSG